MLILSGRGFSQNPVCSDGYIYLDGDSLIKVYDPSQPLSVNNPSAISIPTLASGAGLALMPSINGGSLSPTFYSTSGGTYWYWDGTGWVDTGHNVGNNVAVNLAGCGSVIYNLAGFSGQVYTYNAAGHGSLLTTLSGFNGGGPYDLVTDCNCNFYALRTAMPNQGLSMYSPNGTLLCTYTLSGMPNVSSGGGFAIIGNKIYVKNNTTAGFYIGTISNGGISFTATPGFNGSPGDFGSCSVCYPATSLNGTTVNGGVLGCTVPSVNLAVTTTASPVTYSWTGPGILGSTTASVATVNTPGIYTCVIEQGSCPPAQITLTSSVLSNSINLVTTLNPSGTGCMRANTPIKLEVIHTSTNASISWQGPSLSGGNTTDSVFVSAVGVYTVSVTDIESGCTSTDVITVNSTPNLSLSISSKTLCLDNFNNSPATVVISPSGALSYSLLTSSNFSTTTPTGSVMTCIPVKNPGGFIAEATATLIGANGSCTDTLVEHFSIIPNPDLVLSEPSATICLGSRREFSVSGASSYMWLPKPNYTLTSNSSIIASPTITSFYSVIGSHNGCFSDTRNIVVLVRPIPDVSVTPGATTVCAGNIVVLDAFGSEASYYWLSSEPLASNFGSQLKIKPTGVQSYTVVSSFNTCTNQAVATISTIVVPVISASAKQPTICSNATTSLTAIGADSFIWYPPAQLNFSNGKEVVVKLPYSTTYTIQGFNGICSGSTTLHVHTLEPPKLNLFAESNQVCEGAHLDLSASGANSYTWLPAGTFVQSSAGNSIIAMPLTNTNYTVVGANSSGTLSCYQQLSYSVMVVPVIKPAVSPNVSLCLGEKTTLSASGGNSYRWTPTYGINLSNASRVVANPTVTTVYTVEVSHNRHCANTTTVKVTVNPKPFLYAGRDTVYNFNEPVFIEAKGSDSITWIMGEGVVCANCPYTQVYPTRRGCYVAEAVNSFGCKVSDDICIDIIREFSAYIPNSFTPNNDGINDVFLVYGENILQVSMEIYDRWGARIFYSEDYTVGWDGRYKNEWCPAGVYTYIIKYTGLNKKRYVENGHVSIIK